MGHLQVSACELFNGPSLIWALRAEGPLVYRCLLHGTHFYASPGPDNTTIELLMTGNMLPDPVCQQGTVQSGGASVVVWDVCSWRDMGPLISLETTLTGERYFSILSDHLHSFMSIVHSDGLGQFQQDNATPHASLLLSSGSRNTLLTLDTSTDHLNPQA
ncbi:hypothetical protein AVEN_260726-1 [Araneus ventricosus]|uniref:Uncharacterized protein n=1 Tax=Araneus ventricosus TaxID=182803 RepID=A0A4Y2UW67_ARAVE|nr:hypothetical protein AVEN_260726-1 [Araneus ventricosus]